MFGSFFKREDKSNEEFGDDMKKVTSNYGFIADNKKK
jgi:hypothetical protein